MEDRYLASREEKLILLVAQWIINDYRPIEIGKILTQNLVDWENFNFLLAGHFQIKYFLPRILNSYLTLLSQSHFKFGALKNFW